MKIIGYIIGVCALLVLVYYFYPEKSAPIRNFPSGGTDIVAFGDSLVEGVGATEGNNFVALLEKKIGRPIVNLGRSGDTTAQGLARISNLDPYHPQVVLVLLGGNDHLRKVPQEETFANLDKIMTNIENRGAVVLVLGIRNSLLNDRFDDDFEILTKEHQSAYVPDVLDGLIGRSEYMSDPIHPNDKGYAQIANRIYPVLLPLLQNTK